VSDILPLQLVVIVCGTIGFVSSLRFARRYLELRHERSLRAPSDDLAQRLDRIEQAVESTAVEVERIAEASRFVAKLLAEREPSIGKLAKSPERVITPH
jgi:hypothetical protein